MQKSTNLYRRLVESRIWQEQRMPAVVLAATGLMAIVGMASVAVAAAGWSTTTEVSVDGVTVEPDSPVPVGVAVRYSLSPGAPLPRSASPVSPAAAEPTLGPATSAPASPIETAEKPDTAEEADRPEETAKTEPTESPTPTPATESTALPPAPEPEPTRSADPTPAAPQPSTEPAP